ncbi:hypothetical protein sos41_33890 [Alphaproteobacteria bacterium SO-S41]|nr:hypothetical protein sos41_33890 [Alphaproteobacteria bacterium SO-S41]
MRRVKRTANGIIMSLRTAAILAGFLPLIAFAPTALADDLCPVVKVEKEAGRLAVYPGGAPGRNKLDYAYIAVVLSATAVCHEDDNDNIVADVTVTYALEPGPLYRGSADIEVFSSVMRDGNVVGRQVTAKKTSSPPKDGGAVTLSLTATGLVAGDEDTLETGGTTIAAGFVKEAVTP